MGECGCQFEAKNKAQRQVLTVLLMVNALMFFVVMIAGIIAGSTALVADSLDNFADAAVFGISFYAIGKNKGKKNRAALYSGIFQITLAGFALVNVLKQFFFGVEPESGLMIAIALLSLIANVFCLFLMAKHRHQDIHMRASWIFLSNDVIANLGVVIAGILVTLLHSRFPDLIMGLILAIIVLGGGIKIIRETQSKTLQRS